MRGQIFLIFFLLQSIVSCQQANNAFNPLTASLVPETTKQAAPTSLKNETLYQSTDGGQTLQNISHLLPESIKSGGLYAAGEQLFLNNDHGLMYSRSSTPQPIWEKALLPNEGISGVFPGQKGFYARSYYGNVFQNIPGTSIWNPVFKNMKVNMIFTLRELKEGHIVAACNKGVFKTTDGGNTWQQVFDGGFVWTMNYTDGIFLAACEKGLIRSTDDGNTWNFVFKSSSATQAICALGDRLVHISGNLKPWKQNMEPNDIKNEIHISTDKGKTWQPEDFGLFDFSSVYNSEKRPQVRFVHDMAQVGQYLFCSTDSGVFRSANQGKTWELMLPVTDDILYTFSVSGRIIYMIKDRPLGGC